ncbi:alpha-ketoglutarate-dependent 2 [Colletotrichum somersetense]|nr:alpha-ketoglutarate-dependent 2 [Colletotrichum somersetense]
MSLTIQPLHLTFAAEIRGVDFSKPFTEDVFQEIRDAISKYGVLVFRKTGLDDERHVTFASRFDELECRKDTGAPSRMSRPELTDQGNIDSNGDVIGASDPRAQISKGNMLFYVDSSFNSRRASYSILLAHEIPPAGGDGNTNFKACPEFFAKLEPEKHSMSKHMVAQLHQASGRMSLFVPSHWHHIEGLKTEEGREKLEFLYRHATQDKFVVSVPWHEVGGLVMWDNTCTFHRGTPLAGLHKRDMRRATVLDGSEEAWGMNERVEKDFAFAPKVMADVFRSLSG